MVKHSAKAIQITPAVPATIGSLTGKQLRFAVDYLIDAGELSDKAVLTAFEDAIRVPARTLITPGVSNIRMKRAGGQGGRPKASSKSRPAQAAGKPARKPAAGGHQPSASRKLQGRYIACIRQVPKSKRGHFKAIVKQSGREEAIVAIERFLSERAYSRAASA